MERKLEICEGLRQNKIVSHIENLLDYKFKNIELLLSAYRPNDSVGQRLKVYGKNIFNARCYKINETSRSNYYDGSLITPKDEIKLATLVDVYGIARLFVDGNPNPSDNDKIAVFYKLLGAVTLDCDWDPFILKKVLNTILPNLVVYDVNELAWLRTFVMRFSKGKFFEKYTNESSFAIQIEGIDFDLYEFDDDIISGECTTYYARVKYAKALKRYLIEQSLIFTDGNDDDYKNLQMDDSVYIEDTLRDYL